MYIQLKRRQCVHSSLLLSSPIREISSSVKKICVWINWLIDKKVYLLTRLSMAHTCWKTFSIMKMLGIKYNLEILVTWRYHYVQQHNLNCLFATGPSIRGMAYQVTCAANHHSVLSRINYTTIVSLSSIVSKYT